ncbi:HERC1 (predicted) [Pycnogonum litorale]
MDSVKYIPEVKLKFSDHLNTTWALQDCDQVTTRELCNRLYDLLIQSGEITVMPQKIFPLKNPDLPEYEPAVISPDDQVNYMNDLLSCQLNLARRIFSDSSYAIHIKRKIHVLQRIYYAVFNKYHDQSKLKQDESCDGSTKDSSVESNSIVKCRTGTEALVQMGVKTGLSLLFALLRQCWTHNGNSLQPTMIICNEVLSTAIDVVRSLPPLSLANEAKMPSLGLETINQVTEFLHSCTLPQSNVDANGKLRCCEILLGIASQRGSLRYLLQWIEMALQASSGSNSRNMTITNTFFKEVLSQMSYSANPLERSHESVASYSCDENDHDEILLYQAAVRFMEEVCFLAQDYAKSFVLVDESKALNRENVDELSSYDKSEVYVFGSNSTHQIAEGGQEKITQPKLATWFGNPVMVEAGQYCTFLIYNDGVVRACGKGSYGRLGLGDSNNQPSPRKVEFEGIQVRIKKITTAKGSDGHSLALTAAGEIYSWGDGDYGKLGHGNGVTYKVPRLIHGPLQGKVVKSISAGFRHSACVTECGEVFTWGEGDYGRLGHGDNNTRQLPTLVKDISGAGQVACGCSHTLVVSNDGKIVWSFGSGDNGKLGHGDTSRVYRPTVIETLSGTLIRKVVGGNQSSLALTTSGQVYSWGFGPCLGCGSSESTFLIPRLVDDLANVRVVDVVIGDGHCIALTNDNQIYCWGNNVMGQCGLDHTLSPVTKPKKVQGIDGVKVHQISAGTSHTIVWTALPTDRQVVAWHRPFCIDIHEKTFSLLRSFLEHYCDSFTYKIPPSPFSNPREHHHFVQLCLKLLCTHLSLSVAGCVTPSLLGNQAKPLRNILFRLLDVETTPSIEQCVNDTLAIGAPLLLPLLKERMELLELLLPQTPEAWDTLTKGQKIQLSIILTSLEDSHHVTTLLGYTTPSNVKDASLIDEFKDMQLAESLMSILLKNMTFRTEQILNDLEKNSDKAEAKSTIKNSTDPPIRLHRLLSSLHKHILAQCYMDANQNSKISMAMCLLRRHVSQVLFQTNKIILKTCNMLKEVSDNGAKHNLINKLEGVLYGSPAGSMFSMLLYSVLVLPAVAIQPWMDDLIMLLPNLDTLNRLLPGAIDSEKHNLEGVEATKAVAKWEWLLDIERTCALLIGRCLSGMLISLPTTREETECKSWLESNILSNGLEYSARDTDTFVSNILVNVFSDAERPNLPNDRLKNLDVDMKSLVEMALGISHMRLYEKMIDFGLSFDWETASVSDEPLLDKVSRFLLACLLKHCNLASIVNHDCRSSDKHIQELYNMVFKVRQKLMSLKLAERDKFEGDKISEGSRIDSKDDHNQQYINDETEDISEQSENFADVNVNSYEHNCKLIIRRCVFFLVGVRAQDSLENSPILKDLKKNCDHSSTTPISIVCKIAESIVQFVCAEGAKSGKERNLGRCSDPYTVAFAMEQQEMRADSRLHALKKFSKILNSFANIECRNRCPVVPDISTHLLLNSVYLQLLSGCFGLCVLTKEDSYPESQLYHYQDGIEAASVIVQRNIQAQVHSIYKHLVKALGHAEAGKLPQTPGSKLLSLMNVFALSVKYQQQDVNFAIMSNILPLLSKMSGESSVWFTPKPLMFLAAQVDKTFHKYVDSVLQLSSLRLLQIIAVATGLHADELSSHLIKSVVDLLMNQISKMFDMISKMSSSSSVECLKKFKNSLTNYLERGKLRNMFEVYLGDLMIFTRKVITCEKIKKTFADSVEWIHLLLSIIGVDEEDGIFVPSILSVRSRILSLQFLSAILPSIDHHSKALDTSEIVSELFNLLSINMWTSSVIKSSVIGSTCKKNDDRSSNLVNYDDFVNHQVHDICFDVEKCTGCMVDNNVLLHNSGGRAYGLAAHQITSGCHLWKVEILKENKGNEGTCIGVAKYPVRDYSHRTTSDMWLYRAYSGNTYHNGETPVMLPTYTQGDVITIVLNMDYKTISFAKNNERPVVVFEDFDANELYPCIMFYSSNLGEKAKISDLQVACTSRELMAGDPFCAPSYVVLVEEYINLIQILHSNENWTNPINDEIIKRLSQMDNIFDTLDDTELSDSKQASEQRREQTNEKVNIKPYVEKLCFEVWPALAVISSVDTGLRMGGRCVQSTTMRYGTILGMVKPGSCNIRLQWDDSNHSTSDVPVSSVEPVRKSYFNVPKLSQLPASIIRNLATLSGVTNQLTFLDDKSSNGDTDGSTKSNGDPKPSMEACTVASDDAIKPSTTVESLSDTLVNNIIHEVTQNVRNEPSASISSTESNDSGHLIDQEMLQLKLHHLQIAALKTVSVIVSCERYSNLFKLN